MKRLDSYWYHENPVSRLLAPLSWLYCALSGARRAAYRRGLLRSHRVGVPVVVVGNITVGGSGKTPVVIWTAGLLRDAGLRVGIVSRGYRGASPTWPVEVGPESDPALVGDEPLLLARRTGCPVVVGPDRVAAARHLLARYPVEVIVTDDGMQHYRLAREVEIAVVDGRRGLGNGRCLPAGPLRERAARLRSVGMVVTNGGGGEGYPMRLSGDTLVSLATGERRHLADFHGRSVHAVAGVGNPEPFFEGLRRAGVRVVAHPFADHYAFGADDLAFGDDLPVIMTEKDAVKCRSFARNHHWFLPVEAELPEAAGGHLLNLLKR